LVFLGGGVVACEKICAVDVSPFPAAVECAHDNEIETIPYAREIILLNLHINTASKERRRFGRGDL